MPNEGPDSDLSQRPVFLSYARGDSPPAQRIADDPRIKAMIADPANRLPFN